MNHKSVLLRLVLMFILLLPASALGETKVIVVSDVLNFVRKLYEGSDLFIRVLRKGDGKLTQYSDELLTMVHRQIEAEQPDALPVTRNPPFNGEQASRKA